VTAEDRSREPTAEPGARAVPVAWAALEDAFENNAPEVHSYLHLVTGDVIRVVDGVADPVTHARIVADPGYRRVDPVSSREQYRWMERFIATVEDGAARVKLLQSIDGKGAFRRFKDALMGFSNERERWFSFRSERLKMCMEAWLEAQGIRAVARPDWPVPEVAAVEAAVVPPPEPPVSTPPPVLRRASVPAVRDVRDVRSVLTQLVAGLTVSEAETALAFVEFLHTRRSPGTDDTFRALAAPSEPAPASPPVLERGAERMVELSEPTLASAPRRVLSPRSAEATARSADPSEPSRRVVSADPEPSRKPAMPSVVGGAAGDEPDPTRRSSRA
jgi:Uncharacterised protein family (UPF0158)